MSKAKAEFVLHYVQYILRRKNIKVLSSGCIWSATFSLNTFLNFLQIKWTILLFAKELLNTCIYIYMWNSYSRNVSQVVPLLSTSYYLSYVSTQTGRFKLGFRKQPSLNVTCTEKQYFESFRNTKREEMCFLFSKNQKKDFDHHHLSSDGFTSNPSDFKPYLKRDL